MNISSLLFGKRKSDEEEYFLKNRAPIRTIPYELRSLVHRKITGNHIYLEAGSGKPVILSIAAAFTELPLAHSALVSVGYIIGFSGIAILVYYFNMRQHRVIQ